MRKHPPIYYKVRTAVRFVVWFPIGAFAMYWFFNIPYLYGSKL